MRACQRDGAGGTACSACGWCLQLLGDFSHLVVWELGREGEDGIHLRVSSLPVAVLEVATWVDPTVLYWGSLGGHREKVSPAWAPTLG